MNAAARRTPKRTLGMTLGVVGLIVATAHAAMAQGYAGPSAQRAYRLRSARADDVVGPLHSMLNDAQLRSEILIDRERNQIVLTCAEDVHRLAAQLIETLDRGDAVVQVAAAQPNTVKGYSVRRDDLDKLAEQLTQKYKDRSGVRIAKDARTSQLIVVASEPIHREVAQLLGQRATSDAEPGPMPVGVGVRDTSYPLRNLTWREFEDTLRRLWGPGLNIMSQQNGESATIELDPTGAADALLQIDRRRGVIHFVGDERVTGPWRKIVQSIDRDRVAPGDDLQITSIDRADPAKIQQAVNLIRAASFQRGPGEVAGARQLGGGSRVRWGGNLVSMIFQDPNGLPAAGGGQEPAQPAPGQGQQPGLPILPIEDGGGILGDVQIEFVPELGVIIVRGKRQDVQRVLELIDKIEAESQLTRPEVEVYVLEHTNSEAMATLLTQVYTEVYLPRQGSLSITALVKPNALLLIGRMENIATAKTELIEKLDQPVPPSTQIKVFQLKHMAALDAQTHLQGIYGAAAPGAAAADRPGLATRVTVIADFRSNSLIVQASPRDLEEVASVLDNLDVETGPASIELRVFPLRNSLATDLQTVLQNAIGVSAPGATAPGAAPGAVGGAGVQPGPNTASKSVQIMEIDQNGNKIIESGILADVSVAADPNLNALVIRAPSRSMSLIAKLIEQLDRIPEAESQIKVFQIQNGDATALAGMLQLLFGQQVTVGQVGVFSQTVGQTFGAGALQQAATTAGESSLIPLNFAVDPRTNTIIVAGSPGDLAVVEAILVRLDEGDLRQRRVRVYRLNNAPAEFVADALTQILQQQQQLSASQQQQQFSTISQFEFLDQQVFVTPEVISNSLIVSATPTYYDQITDVIMDLDRRPPMIMIQVVIALVRLNDNEELGVELGIQDSLLFDRGLTGATLMPGFNFIGQSLGNAGSAQSLATRGKVAGQAFSGFNVGRQSASSGFPGLVLSASNESVNLLIRALAEKSKLQILSRPQIMTMNNVPASVLIGQRVPRVTDFQTTTTGTVNSVTLDEIGVSLGVIPRVTPDGLIIMDLETSKSSVGPVNEGIPIGVQDGVPILSPIFDDITAVSTISARSGQTVVFAGLIETTRSKSFRGIPLISQIPVVGRLFRFDAESLLRQELLIFMTPHIVNGKEDLEAINNAEAQRMSWCMADVIELHGDPGFYATSGYIHEETPLIYPDQDPTAGAARQDARPFVLPPDQRVPGRPFMLPPDQRTEGRPFLDPPESSSRREPGVRIEYQAPRPGHNAGQAPHPHASLPGPVVPAGYQPVNGQPYPYPYPQAYPPDTGPAAGPYGPQPPPTRLPLPR